MAIQPILRMGDPRLHRVCHPVIELDTPELHQLVVDLWETMAANDGAGLAAPQIGVALRVVVFAVEDNPRYPEAPCVPRTILVNPIITPLDDTLASGWEGCLSIPGMRGKVARYDRVRYSGFDAFGQVIERTAEGFHARVVQHECDHLDGILYPQRMTDLSEFGFSDEIHMAGRDRDNPD